MKMSDVFELPVSPDPGAVWYGHKGAGTTRAEFERATAHAINCHDDLVAALESIISAHDVGVLDDPIGWSTADTAARAALAKARGEVP